MTYLPISTVFELNFTIPNDDVYLGTLILYVRLNDTEILEIEPPGAVGYMMTPFTKWREGSTAFN